MLGDVTAPPSTDGNHSTDYLRYPSGRSTTAPSPRIRSSSALRAPGSPSQPGSSARLARRSRACLDPWRLAQIYFFFAGPIAWAAGQWLAGGARRHRGCASTAPIGSSDCSTGSSIPSTITRRWWGRGRGMAAAGRRRYLQRVIYARATGSTSPCCSTPDAHPGGDVHGAPRRRGRCSCPWAGPALRSTAATRSCRARWAGTHLPERLRRTSRWLDGLLSDWIVCGSGASRSVRDHPARRPGDDGLGMLAGPLRRGEARRRGQSSGGSGRRPDEGSGVRLGGRAAVTAAAGRERGRLQRRRPSSGGARGRTVGRLNMSRLTFSLRRRWRNHAGNQGIDPLRVDPADERRGLVEIVRAAERDGATVRAVGSGHSWSDVALTRGFLILPTGLATAADLGEALLKPGRSDASRWCECRPACASGSSTRTWTHAVWRCATWAATTARRSPA